MLDPKDIPKHLGIGALQTLGGYVLAGAIFVVSIAVTWVVSRGTGQPEMTRFDAVVLTLGVAFALVALLAIAVLIYPRAAAIWVSWFPRSSAQQQAARAPASDVAATDPEQVAQDDASPIEFKFEGRWLNTPFKCEPIGTNEQGDGQFGEDLYLTVRANKYLEQVKLIIVASDPERPNSQIEYHHRGLIEGTVTPTMGETIRLFRRTFCLARTAISNEKGGHTHTLIRKDVKASFFEGAAERTVSLPNIYSVEMILHHRQGAERAVFSLDLRSLEAPRSRLIVSRGHIQISMPNKYGSPQFPPTVCT